MTFNKGARLDASNVRRGGRRGGIAVGGGIGTVVILYLLSQAFGVDLTGLLDPGPQETAAVDLQERCRTGEDANRDVECRMVGAANSLEGYWRGELPRHGLTYRSPTLVLFAGQTGSGCGSATAAVGPFYCPADEGVYLDVEFFEVLTHRLGAEEGPLSQMYVLAHEWGHHVQNIAGTISGVDRTSAGPGSEAVRLELQADCYAGAWVGQAATTTDAAGAALLEPFTDAQLAAALSAAAAVGDDRIQAQHGPITPDTWTHGSAEERQGWFVAGMEGGPGACDTFAGD